MSKELPYFQFFINEWLNDDISIASFKVKGVFIDICSFYWFKDCDVSLAQLKQRFSTAIKEINYLIENQIVKKTDQNYIKIKFLDDQLDLLASIRAKKQESGRKGGLAKAKQRSSGASLLEKQHSSNIDKDIDKDTDKNTNTSVEINEEILIERIRSFHNKKIHSQDHKYIMKMVLECRGKNIDELWKQYKAYKETSGERVHTDLTVLFGSPEIDYKDGVIHNNDYQLKYIFRFQLPTPHQIRQLNGQEYQQLIKDAKIDGWGHVEGQNRHFKKGETIISY